MSATALVRSPKRSIMKRSPTQSQTQDQVSRHSLFEVYNKGSKGKEDECCKSGRQKKLTSQ